MPSSFLVAGGESFQCPWLDHLRHDEQLRVDHDEVSVELSSCSNLVDSV